MSVCTFIASDHPLPTVRPSQEYPLEINIDTGTVYDGGADDNFFLLDFPKVWRYTDKRYGVFLEWRYTEGRGKAVLQYLKENLKHTDTIELWHVWLMDYWEYEDRPILQRYSASIGELTASDIQELDNADIWTPKEQIRPTFHCLTITP